MFSGFILVVCELFLFIKCLNNRIKSLKEVKKSNKVNIIHRITFGKQQETTSFIANYLTSYVSTLIFASATIQLKAYIIHLKEALLSK